MDARERAAKLLKDWLLKEHDKSIRMHEYQGIDVIDLTFYAGDFRQLEEMIAEELVKCSPSAK